MGTNMNVSWTSSPSSSLSSSSSVVTRWWWWFCSVGVGIWLIQWISSSPTQSLFKLDPFIIIAIIGSFIVLILHSFESYSLVSSDSPSLLVLIFYPAVLLLLSSSCNVLFQRLLSKLYGIPHHFSSSSSAAASSPSLILCSGELQKELTTDTMNKFTMILNRCEVFHTGADSVLYVAAHREFTMLAARIGCDARYLVDGQTVAYRVDCVLYWEWRGSICTNVVVIILYVELI